MGMFTNRVREEKTSGPNLRSFSLQKWEKDFAEHGSDDGDKELFDAGQLIHSKLEAIRKILKFSSDEAISATTKLRSFASMVNYNFIVTLEKTDKEHRAKRAEATAPITAEEATAVKIESACGHQWSPQEVIESLIDGIEIPASIVIKQTPSLAGNPSMQRVDWHEVAKELNLGLMYRFAEDLWFDVLWNGYKVVDGGLSKIFVPTELDYIKGFRIGVERRHSLTRSFALIGAQAHRDLVELGIPFKLHDIKAIERIGKRQVIKVERTPQGSTLLSDIVSLRAMASEPYYDDLLTEPQPGLGELTISSLLDVWTVISRASQILADGVKQRHAQRAGKEGQIHVWLPEYAPVLQLGALEEAVSAAVSVSPKLSRQLVEFFIFRGSRGQELWSQPLLPAGPGTVMPLFAATISPNLRRLVDVWMRQAKVDLGRRGPAFEDYLRNLVIETLRESTVLRASRCLESSFTFKPQRGQGEEVDLLFVIGDTVFIAEAKCVVEPTDAKSMAFHRKTVHGAANQVARKTKAIFENRSEFVLAMAREKIQLKEDFKVISLVVVSTATHVGVPVNDIPVIDDLILKRFLIGELEDVAVDLGDLSVHERVKTMLYATAQEAEDRASRYFQSPPQLSRFFKGIRKRAVPIFAATDVDWGGSLITLECVPVGGLPLTFDVVDERSTPWVQKDSANTPRSVPT
ncbi:hypothetical protein [Xanthomonas hortorum]|uniref:hypothetical protein n=1 Tax=Xanthomonas hortorum TaxID=56454 RepID=UPI001593A36C|nr:hypothetical protein [Xanthomonas hortorum]NHF64525.1 hypothetical protein [Xanthomonas hortorum]